MNVGLGEATEEHSEGQGQGGDRRQGEGRCGSQGEGEAAGGWEETKVGGDKVRMCVSSL